MDIYIALFRGINVGGKNKLPMNELIGILEELGCQNVRTYIQSGNVVFKSNENNGSRLSKRISQGIKEYHGFAPTILLLRPEDLEKIVAKNPFPEAKNDPKSLHIGFLASIPKEPNLKTLESIRAESERYRLIDKAFYLYAPDGIGRSKLAAKTEKLLGVQMTDRNWRTVSKILEMVNEII